MQNSLINSDVLPTRANSPFSGDADIEYGKRGIRVIGKPDGDDLFYLCELPNGWMKQATDHSMWSNLIDSNGRVVATIFYKAAFYDRAAFINFEDAGDVA